MDKRELFLQQLKLGDLWADHVAAEIRKLGKEAVASPHQVATTQAERDMFTEFDKDIKLSRDRVLEVKSRSLSFTDDPATFPYETAFIDTVEGWKAKDVTPVAVAIVSQKTGAIVIAPVSKQPEWSQSRVHDRLRGFDITVYECPRIFLKSFREFVAWL